MKLQYLAIIFLITVQPGHASSFEQSLKRAIESRRLKLICDVQINAGLVPTACYKLKSPVKINLNEVCKRAVTRAQVSTDLAIPEQDLLAVDENCKRILTERSKDLQYKESKRSIRESY